MGFFPADKGCHVPAYLVKCAINDVKAWFWVEKKIGGSDFKGQLVSDIVHEKVMVVESRLPVCIRHVVRSTPERRGY